MKKALIIGLIVILVLGGALALTILLKSQANKETSIIGSWKNNELNIDFIYTFNADGTGNYNAAGTIMEFTYTTEGDDISILYKGDTIPFETKYSINDDTLNVIDSLGQDTLYKKVK